MSEDIIHLYRRAEPLADAELVDVSEMAQRAGFTVPVAVTRAAWDECVAWTGEAAKSKSPDRSEAGRLWDMLFRGRLAARRRPRSNCTYALYRVPTESEEFHPRRVMLSLQAHSGDEGELVITIRLPFEG